MTRPLPEIPERFRDDIDALPPLLRALLDAELSLGNSIVEVTHLHPAPPTGACIMLANPVSSRARASGDGVTFRASGSSLYNASFTDQNARFFILESPVAEAGAYPDMDAIRDAANQPRPSTPISSGSASADKFRASMHIDYEKWHDGIGFDLDVLNSATDADKALIIGMLIPPNGWREVEALVAIDSDQSRAALRKALQSGNAEVRAAVLRYAPSIASDDERLATLLEALEHAQIYGGLTAALDQVESFHPPEIINALFRGLLVRPGDVATHYAAMLAFLHGKAESNFDWELRPLFLKFNSHDGAERQRAFVELCQLLELDSEEVQQRIKR